ncbi:MAG: SpoIIE family protein phosphatase [Spirochaetes bacterium]|nr:SpoIIE family protein phosphatase [Spirochaetota bacterium]
MFRRTIPLLALIALALSSTILHAETGSRALGVAGDRLEYRWGDSPADGRGSFSWMTGDSAAWQQFTLPGEPPGRDARTNLWVRVKIPDCVYPTPALMTSGVHQAFEVYLDGRAIYRFGELDSSGKAAFPGYRWHHIIPLPGDCGGKFVYFRVYSKFLNIGFSSLALGNRTDLVVSIVQRDIHKFSLGVIIAITGIVALVFFLSRRKKFIGQVPVNEQIYLYFSIFTVAIGVAIAADTALKELIWDAPMAWIHVRMACMCLFGVGLAGFIIQIDEIRYRFLLRGLFFLYVAYTFAAFLLVAAGLIGVMSLILPYNLLILVSIPIMLFCIAATSFRGNRDATIFTTGFVILIAVGVRDALMDMGMLPRGEFIHHWGILVFIVSLGIILARRFSDTYTRFYEYQQNLELARNIQRSNLPRQVPGVERLRISAKYIPMQRVGGDFYGFHAVDSKRMGVLLTDVSGHGIPSAMISSMIRLSFDLAAEHAHDPSRLLEALNAMLIEKIEKNFITASYCYLDLEQMKLCSGNAGHPSLYIWNNDGGRLVEIRPRGMFLGRFTDIQCVTEETDIRPGDKIVIYTDGITEAMNRRGELFGEKSLEDFIRGWHGLPAEEFIARLLDHVRAWSGRSDDGFDDDLTIIVIDVL